MLHRFPPKYNYKCNEMICEFALLSDTVGPEDLESRRFLKHRWSQRVSSRFPSLRACPPTPQKPPEVADLSAPSRLCVPLEMWKWSKSLLSTSINIPSGSLKSPRIHPGWGGWRSTCASETEPERRFSFNMEGSERQSWAFWELWKLSRCQHMEAVFSSQTPEVPNTHQTLSVRGKQRNQKYENCVLMCWTSKGPAD